MSAPTALVTGAGGFVGRHVVRSLHERGYRVIAGVHAPRDCGAFAGLDGVETVHADVLDRRALDQALGGVDEVYHVAALVDAHKPRAQLQLVNAEGTRNVWECAARQGVGRALYCSSAAVYGLLSRSSRPIDEGVPARAVEPYGRSKRLGEEAALAVAARTGVHTVVIRPVAVFGPGEHTPFGNALRAAAVSRLLVAGGFESKSFNYVHVEDVAQAAVFLLQRDSPNGTTYNVCAPQPIPYEQALREYIRMLKRAGASHARVKMLARISEALHSRPSLLRWLRRSSSDRFFFPVWQLGFDMQYSSAKLCATSFRFVWTDFQEVLFSCLRNELQGTPT
jgi:nucleoside-diphosphate-sugar epimerase